MKCPIDDVELVMSDRQGIEIDYCPKCRGVWLDRGELDKIIERSAAAPQPQQAQRAEEPRRAEPHHEDRDRRYDNHSDHGRKPYKKRESFLGDLFDF
jgi:Zn-finger nucleic acid-binding protein